MEFGTWLITDSFVANKSPWIDPSSTLDDFETWFLTNGGYIHPSIELASSPSAGNFLRVMPENVVPPSTNVVSCPHSLALSWPSARKFHYPDVQLPTCTQHVATRLFLMKQKLLKDQSPWWPYIRMLPETFGTPLYYDSEDFSWIRGTNLGRAKEMREDAWREEYDEAMRTVLPVDMIEEKRRLWTWELYLWAATVMSSRSFPGPAVFNQPECDYPTYIDNHEGRAPVLIPGLDLLNHIPNSPVSWLWDPTTCTIKTNELLPAGSEVPNNYGSKSNEELIMGYGFSLRDNFADHFSIGFSPAIVTYISAIKAARSIKNEGLLSAFADSSGSKPSGTIQHHWVSMRDGEAVFSSDFLEDASIAFQNPRECKQASLTPNSTRSLSQIAFSRNKLHVMCAIFMILQKGQLAIRKHDSDLPEQPRSAKQVDAARYRHNQLDILDGVIESLTAQLRSLVKGDITGSRHIRIVRLEDTLTDSPKSLVKDFRSVLNTGIKTRDPVKIRERGGTDFAYTIWLYGLCIYQHTHAGDHPVGQCSESRLSASWSNWLRFLCESYPDDGKYSEATQGDPIAIQESGQAQWFDPVRNQAFDGETVADSASTVATYLNAIHATVNKHPQSIYNNPNVTARRLEWCYNVVKNEGVWFPNLIDREEDDEWMLVLETVEGQT